MANTKVIDAQVADAISGVQSLSTPCVIHCSGLQAGDLMVVETAPSETESEFVPMGQESIIKGSGGGVIVVNVLTGVSYKLRVRFKASTAPGRAALPGASAYVMTA